MRAKNTGFLCQNKNILRFFVRQFRNKIKRPVVSETYLIMAKYFPKTSCKKIFPIAFIFIIGAASGYFTYKMIARQKEVKRVLIETVNRANEECPIRMNRFLQIDSAFVISQKSIQYDCSLPEATKDEVSIGALKKYMEPDIKYWINANPVSAYLSKNKITLVYSISDKNGEFIYKFAVSSYEPETAGM